VVLQGERFRQNAHELRNRLPHVGLGDRPKQEFGLSDHPKTGSSAFC